MLRFKLLKSIADVMCKVQTSLKKDIDASKSSTQRFTALALQLAELFRALLRVFNVQAFRETHTVPLACSSGNIHLNIYFIICYYIFAEKTFVIMFRI